MLIYLDTEFTELARDAKLLSIGLVSENGTSFYAELADGWCLDDCSDFVVQVVLPLMEGNECRRPWTK